MANSGRDETSTRKLILAVVDCKTVRILAQGSAEPGPRLARELSALRASQFARRAQYLEKKRDCFAVYGRC